MDSIAPYIYFVELILAIVYLVGIIYLLIFRLGLSMKDKRVVFPRAGKRVEVDVIIPVYREKNETIKRCLDSLARQRGLKVNALIVAKEVGNAELQFIKSYKNRFNSLKIINQIGTPYLNRAQMIGLKHVKTEFSSILQIDSVILDNALYKLVLLAKRENADAAFGISLPEKPTTRIGKFTSIEKVFRQFLLLKGRGALGLGYYFPGNFAVLKTSSVRATITKLLRNNKFAMYDLALTVHTYASKGKLAFLDEPVSTEAERDSFKKWVFQSARWFLGTIGLLPHYMNFFMKADIKPRVGWLGVLWSWRVLPVALILGLATLILTLGRTTLFLEFYILTYAIATLVLLSIPEERKYGFWYVTLHWLFASFVKTLAIPVSVYQYLFMRFKAKELYKIRTRY